MMKVVVELFAARFVDDELRYVVRRADCPRHTDPQAAARAELAVAFPSLWLHDILVHSTSWRFEDGAVVLTHIAIADEFPTNALPLILPLERVDDERGEEVSAVAAHALRHLGFLVREDPARFAEHFTPATLRRLERVAPDVAGRFRTRAA